MNTLDPLNVGEHDHILIRNVRIDTTAPGAAIGIFIATPHPITAAHKAWFDSASEAEQDAHLAEHEGAANRD